MKYIICAIPMALCIELLSYVCLSAIATMLLWDILKTMEGKW